MNARFVVIALLDGEVVGVVECADESTATELAGKIEARGVDVRAQVSTLDADVVSSSDVDLVRDELFTDPE